MKPLSRMLLTVSGVAFASLAQADLLISEYVEGSGYNKALELYNSGPNTVNLADYQLRRYTNGSSRSSTITLPDTMLSALQPYVLVDNNSQVAADLAAKANTRVALGFNGNDPIALERKSDGVTVDFFGITGGSDFAKDATFARQQLTPYTQDNWKPSDWLVSPKDDFSGLGMAPSGDNSEPPAAFSCQGQSVTPTYQIQGRGTASPLEGQTLITSGVVTRIVSGLYQGAFIQDPLGDGDVTTSDGLFVYSTQLPANIKEGDLVCALGQVREYYDFTELALKGSSIQVLSSGHTVPPVTMSLSDRQTLHDQLEAYEGMLVTTTNSDLVVTRPFSYDYDSKRNNMMLSYKKPLYKSTHIYLAGSNEERALAANNAKGALFIDSDQKAVDGVVPYFSGFNPLDGYIRVGDSVNHLEGVIGYSFSQYRLIPLKGENLAKSDFTHGYTDRTAYGPDIYQKGDLRVASFNVLNLFNSPFGGAANAFGDNRGATTQADYQLQLQKIANAISQLNADVIGLMEIENNGFSDRSAIAALVNKVNRTQPASAGAYEYVKASTPGIGTDAIAVGLLYRPRVVQLKGSAKLIDMPEQHGQDKTGETFNKAQRTSLAQTFVHKDSKQDITVVVNHFKSKGSGCIEDANTEQAGPQSNCNAFRVSAAVALGDYVDANLKGNVLILGDLNSYAKEDPVRVLTGDQVPSAIHPILTAEQATLVGKPINNGESVQVTKGYGYTNLVPQYRGSLAFSYGYNGELGSLDHALASPSLLSHVLDADDWHINAAESNLFEYGSEFTGNLIKSDNPYSSSDHDPVVIELKMHQ